MHNNLVYPLLRRFVENGWVSKRQTSGQRGQTRDVYSLTTKGKQEIFRRIAAFTEKEASSASEFSIRVGMFGLLNEDQRLAILDAREAWLAQQEQNSSHIRGAMDVGEWGGEVLALLQQQRQAEHKWIARLKRKVKKQASV